MACFNSLPFITILFLLSNIILIEPTHQSMPTEKSDLQVSDCWEKLDHQPNFLLDCSEEIDDAWFDRAFSITKQCCQNVLALGTTCYKDIVNDRVSSLNPKDKYVQKLPENSKKVWSYCVSEGGPFIPAE